MRRSFLALTAAASLVVGFSCTSAAVAAHATHHAAASHHSAKHKAAPHKAAPRKAVPRTVHKTVSRNVGHHRGHQHRVSSRIQLNYIVGYGRGYRGGYYRHRGSGYSQMSRVARMYQQQSRLLAALSLQQQRNQLLLQQLQQQQRMQPAEQKAFLATFDTNHNGMIDGSEIGPAQKYLRERRAGLIPPLASSPTAFGALTPAS